MQKNSLKILSVVPRKGQEEYSQALKEKDIVIATGLAGTGKSYIAIREGLTQVLEKKYKKIVFIKSYVPSITGEKIGYLPGNLDEKILPYVQNICDTLEDQFETRDEMEKFISKHFEFSTLSTCRGRSFNNCWIIVDEAQNCMSRGESFKMIFSRLGKKSKLIIIGDLSQMDIDSRDSDLINAINVVQDIPEVAIIEMNDPEIIQRHYLVKKILSAYQEYERNHN